MSDREDIFKLEKEDEKKDSSLSPEEESSLEKDEDVGTDSETWKLSDDKKSENIEKDWEYISKGFDDEMEEYLGKDSDNTTKDFMGDIQSALSGWRTSLEDNHVLDDLLGHSQDVPSASAYGDLVKLIDDYEKRVSGWSIETQSIRSSLKRLKATATRFNESLMKTAAECYSDLEEDVTYRDLIAIAEDPVGYKMEKKISKQNKRTFERLNSYDDEIRGEKDMHEVIAAFMPQGSGDWTAREKQKCQDFIDDYASKDIKRRRPHLERITGQMMDLAVSLETFSPEYMTSHSEQMNYILSQLNYFLTVRNDPVNSDYFRRLSETDQKKLDIINRIGTSFTTGDFVGNIEELSEREDMYRPTAKDHITIDAFMSRGDMSQNVSSFAYDNKVYLESYKRDRY